MGYIIFNNSEERYNAKIHPFTTQNKQKAIRVQSEAPLCLNGFKFYLDDGDLVGDYSEYQYLYQETDRSIEYTTAPTEIVCPIGTYTESKGVSYNMTISSQISSINDKIEKLEQFKPIIMTKQAYIGDTKCEFDKTKDGVILVTLNDLPCDYEVCNNKIIVHFEPLEEMSTVKVSIQ